MYEMTAHKPAFKAFVSAKSHLFFLRMLVVPVCAIITSDLY